MAVEKSESLKGPKLKNEKIERFGRVFDSKAELKFFEKLLGSHKKEDIIIQPKFLLLEGLKLKNGKKQSHITYSADFQVGNTVYEVKGFLTEASRLRIKMFNVKYPELNLKVISENPDKNSPQKFIDYDEAQKIKRLSEKSNSKNKKTVKKSKPIKTQQNYF